MLQCFQRSPKKHAPDIAHIMQSEESQNKTERQLIYFAVSVMISVHHVEPIAS